MSQKRKSSFEELKVPIYIVLGFFVSQIVIFWLLATFFTDPIMNKIPASYETSLGESLYKSKIPTAITNEEIKKNLSEMADLLTSANPYIKNKYALTIVNEKAINAFAAPGGYIFFTRGLIESAQSAEEVLGVLGHEIGHVEQRHTLRRLIKQVLTIIPALLFSGGGADLAGSLTTLKFSREDETQADQLGFYYLYNSKISPTGIIDFFKRIRGANQTGLGSNWLMSHPLPDERINTLTKLAADNPKYIGHKANFDFAAFKQKVLAINIKPPDQK